MKEVKVMKKELVRTVTFCFQEFEQMKGPEGCVAVVVVVVVVVYF